MKCRFWKSMGWSANAERPGLVLFLLESVGKKWKCVGAELYTEERVYVGYWHKTSMSLDLLRRVEKHALKMHGRPDLRTEADLDPIIKPEYWR